ncbi:hypothetical protein PHISCL_08592 [Aspergillus sclerotialis]|uniref:Rhodopsin domain-containing protein n=1 Tax=Aspergillus sclerotialis TaxID=2070753 RepID=A0A3A2ZCN6_9EURO|nr:hypothetical protein PHISCL_08592 [Aspergillus sclerotialis]
MAVSPHGVLLLVFTIVFTVITTVVIGLRLWAVYITKKGLSLHDYWVLLAYFSTLIMCIVVWWAIANGLGARMAHLTPYEIGVQFKLIVAVSMTWLVSTVSCKLSILALYTSLFRSDKRLRYMVWAVYVLIGCYFVAFLALFLTQCRPISYGWNPVPDGSCRSLVTQEILSISLNIFLDTIIALLPMPTLWKLHVNTRKKITIGIMFGLGLVVVAIMAWRLEITLDPETNADFVYSLHIVGLVSFLELWLSMIVVSLPTMAPLYRRYIQPHLSQGGSGQKVNKPQIAEHTIGSAPNNRRDQLTSDPATEYEMYVVTDTTTGKPNTSSQSETLSERRLDV